MVHRCNLKESDISIKKNAFRKAALKWFMIDENNPLCSLYFRSEVAIRKEKLSHLNSGYTYIIHPLSKFREWYEVWLVSFYLMLVIIEPIDACTRFHGFTNVVIFSICFDIVSIVDVIMNCITGYIDNDMYVEMRPKKIIKKYLKSPFFFPDTLGAFPRFILFVFLNKPNSTVLLVQVLISLLRPIRIISLIQLLFKISTYKLMLPKMVVFTTCCMVIFLFILHYCACFHISLSWLLRRYFDANTFTTLTHVYMGRSFSDRYTEYMFRTSAFLLGITLPYSYYTNMRHEEEYILAILTYLVGKILLVTTWVIVASNILNQRSMIIKFQGIMNQLEEYMIQKQIPLPLRGRIREYYHFKYQKKYFKDNIINGMLTEKLRRDVKMDMCKSLVAKVSLFESLTEQQIGEVVTLLIPEIFLEGDIIIQAGTVGDTMYFLSSGTVAVYTHSRKEVCHLQDGAYFGEISLVLKGQLRTATVIAIEICQMYKLKRRDFEKTLFKYRSVFQHIIENAEKRLKETMTIEAAFKKVLFEKTYTFTTT